MSYLYVPESEDLNSDSTSQPGDEPVLCATVSGTPTPRPPSWRGWKNRPYAMLLSGTRLSPSQRERGVERWMSSRLGSPVNPGVKPGSNEGRTTSDGSGVKSRTSSGVRNQGSCSWRTCLDFDVGGFDPCSTTSPRWGMMRSGVLLGRDAWEPPINGTDYSSLRGGGMVGGRSSGGSWPTATAETGAQTKTDPTPKQTGGTSLPGAAQTWPTPVQADGSRDSDQYARGNLMLQGQARLTGTWATPHKNAGNGAGNQGREGGENIQTQAESWATPAARDHKDGNPEADVPTNCLLGRQAPRNNPTGDESSKESRRLNPRFVEWLQGFPIGWSNPLSKVEPSDFEGWVTRWCRYRRRLLSGSSGIGQGRT